MWRLKINFHHHHHHHHLQNAWFMSEDAKDVSNCDTRGTVYSTAYIKTKDVPHDTKLPYFKRIQNIRNLCLNKLSSTRYKSPCNQSHRVLASWFLLMWTSTQSWSVIILQALPNVAMNRFRDQCSQFSVFQDGCSGVPQFYSWCWIWGIHQCPITWGFLIRYVIICK